jgi:stage III sporulation protein AD
MEILQIAGLGVAAALMAMVIRGSRPEMASLLAMAAGALLFFLAVSRLQAVVAVMQTLTQKAGLQEEYLKVLLKVVGVAYVAEFAAQTCRDAGEESLAAKVEMCGKVLVLAMASPIIVSLVELVLGVVP